MIHRRGVVESTMIEARDLPLGDVVVADHQTAGRGRLGRTWEAPPGSGLFATFVLPLEPLAVFRCGVAAAEACAAGVRLKWPNDLLLQDRKLGGVLAEARPPERCLVGIGINLTSAPEGAAMLGGDRDQLLERLIGELERWRSAPGPDVIGRWRQLSDTLGRQVQVDLPGESFSGLAEEIAEDGALLVGGRRVIAGDVRRLRPI